MTDEIRPEGNCPVQAWGPVGDGFYYYFRARWNSWTFDVGPEDPEVGGYVDKPIWGRSGGHPNAGWMPEEEAIRIIQESLKLFRAEPKDRYEIHLEGDSNSGRGWVATVPRLPGCVSQGETWKRVVANITEAIQLTLEDEGSGKGLLEFNFSGDPRDET